MIRNLWDERRGLCIGIGLILLAAVVAIVVFLALPKAESHIVPDDSKILAPDVAVAADESISKALNDYTNAGLYVTSSYMGATYGVDATRWLDAYLPRVSFSVVESYLDEKDGIAYAVVNITHPDEVALSQIVLERQQAIVDEDPVGWTDKMAPVILESISSVEDIETSELLTFVNDGLGWVPDEVSKGTINRYCYGSVL